MTENQILTLEEKILQKIRQSKEFFILYKNLTDLANTKGISFLQHYIHDIYHRHEEELKEMRIDLCRARNE